MKKFPDRPWRTIKDIIREYVAKRHGVYALYRGNRLYYVGLASNLRNRLRHHLRDRHGQSWDRFSVYLTIGDSHIKELESLVLRIVSPPGNKTGGTFGKAENLRNQLSQALRQQLRKEVRELLGGPKRKTPVKPRSTSPKNRKGQSPVLSKYISTPLKLKAKFKKQNRHGQGCEKWDNPFCRENLFFALALSEGSLQPTLQRLDLLELRARAWRLGSFRPVAKVKSGRAALGKNVRHGNGLSRLRGDENAKKRYPLTACVCC